MRSSQPTSPTARTGSCLCGGVRFCIRGELAPIQICHCSQCRKAQGGPLATNVPVQTDQLQWLAGKPLLREFESSPGKVRAFCSVCGSPVYSQRRHQPDVLRIRAGLLDEPLDAPLAFHQYTASRARWWPEAQDTLPQYDTARPA